ncbi:MAG: RloB domain-containing protein [Bacillota bacterium]|nr:RloB domain-containing protein [Bacillota bacterium]
MSNYRKNYLCICEGQQEKMYMNHVAKLIKNFPKKVVTFNTFIDSPHRLKKRYEEYDSVAIFDFDMNEVEFKKNIEICDRLNRDLKSIKRKSERHIYHAYSSVNFDLWLILHKEDYSKIVSRNDAYVQDLRRIYGLNATDSIKSEEINRKILSQITLDDVKEAIHRAEKVRHNKNIDDCQSVGDTKIYTNPDFSIHEFLKIVLIDSGDL